MMGIQLKIIRKKFLKVLLYMIIIISLGVALLFGLMNGVLSLQKSLDKFIEENNYPDIKITTKIDDIDKINSLNKEEFENIEYRLSINTIINKNNHILSVKANTYEDKDIKDFYICEEKENNSKYNSIFVEKGFANNNNIKLGDIIKLKIDEKFYNFFVSKIILIPEAIERCPINGMWEEINDYGNVYINKKIIDEAKQLLNEIEEKDILNENIFGSLENDILKVINEKKQELENIKKYDNKFNEILICLDNTSDKEKVLENIISKDLKDVEVIDSYTYEQSPIYNHINANIESMKSLSTIVPIVFYTIILIVLFLFISLMIKQGKKEIAILKLLGKTNNEIRLGFCICNLIVAILGIILGILIGFFPMVYMVQYFENFFLLPSAVYTIDGLSILLSIVSTIIVVELATIIATLELNKITPVELIKKEEYQNKEISKFTDYVTSKFKPIRKFSILVYIRNKSKLILGIICISATAAIIFSSLAYIASKDKIFNNYFDERIHYDAQVFKSGTITYKEIEELRNIDYIENADLLRYFNVSLRNNNKELNIVINALDNKNHYISILDKDNNEIEYPENGIVLEEHIAKELGLKLNDEITINGFQFKIVDISFQSLGRVNYISLADSYKLKPSFETIVLNMDKEKQDNLINKVSKDNNYIYTVFKDKLKQNNKKTFDSYALPSIIIIIFTLIIGYIIVININTYNLLDQKKNLSIFRSLGFQYSEISQSWFVQSLIQWIISIIIGIPCGVLLSKIYLKIVSSNRREFVYANGIKEICITVILLFLFIYIGHRKCMRNFKKMNIIEEVKDRE